MFSRLKDRAVTTDKLALYGGRPIRDTWLPYGRHTIAEEEIAAVVEVLRSAWITQGSKVEEFEHAVAERWGAKYGVAFSSGTAALHAACVAAGLGPGDEAITTPLTFVATANAIASCGARPVFADIQLDTLNIDPAQIERLITPRTKAILPVDFAGLPADLGAIREIARVRNLLVIEDAAHALGASYRGQKVGTISDMTVFSFHPVKHITTGEGGMVLTGDSSIANRLRKLRHHGIDWADPQRPWLYQISRLGYNYRLSDIHCALGISQLRRFDVGLARRSQIAARYREVFAEMEEITLPAIPSDVSHAWHLFVILLNLNSLSVDRDIIIEALRAENIGATLHYPLIHLQPAYQKKFGYGGGICPVAEAVWTRMITLPLFPSMTEEDVDDVIKAVIKVVRYYALIKGSRKCFTP